MIIKPNRLEISKVDYKNTTDDIKISFALVLQFSVLMTNYVFKEVMKITNKGQREMVSFIFMMIVGLFFLRALPIVLKRIRTLFLLLYIFFISLFLLNFIFFPENGTYLINIGFYFFLIGLPSFLYYFALRDKSMFMKMLIKSSYFQILLAFTFYISLDLNVARYDMTYSYLVLVPVLVITDQFFKDYRKINLFIVVLGLFLILVFGSRGPLLSYLVFIILLFFKKTQNHSYAKRITMILLFLIVASLLYMSFTVIILKTHDFFSTKGIKSRTIDLILNTNIDFSSGREYIYLISIKEILKKPLFGHGIGGDRVFLSGTYTHNFFLEVFVNFGIVFGFAFIIIFLFITGKSLIYKSNMIKSNLVLLFFGLGVVPLFVSGSYWTDTNFWMFLSIIIDIYIEQKDKKMKLGKKNTYCNY